MKELYKALADFQQECPTILKKSQADVTTLKGGKYSYNYADLPAIMEIIDPLLFKSGLLLTQPLITIEGKPYVKTILYHLESGESLESVIEIPRVSFTGMNDYQALGSGITYMRRYSLSILGIVFDEDTDAQGEQVKEAKPELPWMTEKAFNSSVTRIKEANPKIHISEDGNDIELTPSEFYDKLLATYRIKRIWKESLKAEIEMQNTLNEVKEENRIACQYKEVSEEQLDDPYSPSPKIL